MQDSLSYVLCTTARMFIRKVNAQLACLGITAQQTMMLEVIYRMQGRNVNEMSADLKVDRTTFTRGAKALLAKQLIAFEKGFDPRTKKYTITSAGINILRQATNLIDKHEGLLCQKVSYETFTKIQESISSLTYIL